MFKNKNEIFSIISHAVGIPLMVVGTVLLARLAGENPTTKALVVIYGVSGTILFLCSTLYHSFKKEENENNIWRRLDHSAIFFLIAGTYTPLSYFYLTGTMRWGIIIAQWVLVVLGVVFKVFFMNAPRYIGVSIYLAMGWMVIIPLNQFIAAISTKTLAFFAAGGLLYTAGALVYVFKKPDFSSFRFGFHDFFHILILAGAVCHFFMVYFGLKKFIII